MKKAIDVLCDIIFKDSKLGILTSRIGRVDHSQLKMYSKNSNKFIIFKERYNSPILKTDIREIIILRDDRKVSVINEDSKTIKRIRSRRSGKIS